MKIIDFGLAKAIHAETDPESLTHDKFVGTPAFASPEQFEHSALDCAPTFTRWRNTLVRADGKPPFAGHSLEEIHRAQKSNAFPSNNSKQRTSPLA